MNAMQWVWLIAGALLGAYVSQLGATAMGLVLGAAAGGLLGVHRQLKRRLEVLEAQYGERPVVAPVPPEPEAGTPPPSPPPPPPAEPPPPPRPYRPGPVERAINRSAARIRDWFTTGNIPAKVGVVISFFGIAFLLKYAAERDYLAVPVELRLAAVALAAIAALVFGWRSRGDRPAFALALQGGAIGVLYLTVFAAFRLYGVLPDPLAFALMIAFTAGSGILAVVQNASALAVLGSAGGFLAPILISTGGGSHVGLFTYYALLNAAIFAIAWFRAWRALNLLGFVFTFVIGALWGWRYYRPELFATTEPFLVLFFLFYVGIAVLYARRRRLELKSYVDASLVFGTPVAAFPLQAALVKDIAYGLAFSALAVAALYVGLAAWLLRSRRGPELRLAAESFIALGIAFATLAVPMALSARWTAAAWALEGAALVWMGTRQGRRLPVAAGMLLQFAAGAAFVLQGGYPPAAHPVANGYFLGGVLIALAGLFSGGYVGRHPLFGRFTMVPAWVLHLWGLGWWLGTGLNEIYTFVPNDWVFAGTVLLFAATALAAGFWARPLAWSQGQWTAAGLLPVLWLLFLWPLSGFPYGHPFAGGGWLAWPAALAAHYAILRRGLDGAERLAPALHAAALWLIAALITWEVHWGVGRLVPAGVWAAAAAAAVPALLAVLVMRGRDRLRWPLQPYWRAYLGYGAGPVIGLGLLLGLRLILTSPGDPAPLPYLPLLNPLDLALLFTLLAAVLWARYLGATFILPDDALKAGGIVLAGIAFLALTAAVVRTVHHWAEVPWRYEALSASVQVQAALSIVWSLVALAAMLAGARRVNRPAYLAGAALMAIVVGKLFLVDLGNQGTLARVVSFIGVGLLLLVVGYVAPVPPRTAPTDRPMP